MYVKLTFYYENGKLTNQNRRQKKGRNETLTFKLSH